jgi:hypothetical protein
MELASSSSSSINTPRIPMPGTSNEDFLVMAQFMYLVLPLPKVSWDNLEVLLVQGRKWDLQVSPIRLHVGSMQPLHNGYAASL